MTKKSMARQVRDHQEQLRIAALKKGERESDVMWDDLVEIYKHNCALMNTNISYVGILRDRKELLPFYKQPNLLVTYVQTLARDHNELTAVLEELYDQHSSRTGGTVDGDEFMLAAAIGNEYTNFGEKYNAIITPTIGQIQAAVVEAETYYNLAQQNDPATDVNVITDVEVKEVTTN